MVQNLVDYIRQQLSQGYSIIQIRQSLLNYGYPAYQVDQAISISYRTQPQQQIQPQPLQTPSQPQQTVIHKIHIPKGLIITILLLAIIGGSFFSYSKFIKTEKAPETLLDLSLEAISTTAQPGQQISFIKKIESMGTKTRYDVNLVYQLTDENEKIVQINKETVAVETKSTSKSNIKIEEDIEPGKYQLIVTAKYEGKKATASIPIKIYEKEETPTCSDNIKNQKEEEIDCGGPCEKCQSCPVCDDQDSCTEDICSENTNYRCIYQEIDDCRPPYIEEPTQTSTDTIDTGGYVTLEDIKPQLTNLISTDANQAAELCAHVSDILEKDGCFTIIVQITQESNYCQFIEGKTPKDSCYFNLILKTNNFELCEKITSSYFQRSCNSLNKAHEFMNEWMNKILHI